MDSWNTIKYQYQYQYQYQYPKNVNLCLTVGSIIQLACAYTYTHTHTHTHTKVSIPCLKCTLVSIFVYDFNHFHMPKTNPHVHTVAFCFLCQHHITLRAVASIYTGKNMK